MKTLIGAIALIIAAPVAAQTAPPDKPHAGHAQHQQQHGHKSGGHEGHQMDCCKDGKCCSKAKGEAEQKACCAKHGDGQHQQHDRH